MSCTVLKLIDELVKVGALTTTQASTLASSLTVEQRSAEAGPFAKRLIEGGRLSADVVNGALAAVVARATAAKEAAAVDVSEASMMHGIQPLRGVQGRSGSVGSPQSFEEIASSANDADEGLSMMLGNQRLRSTSAGGGSKPAAPSVAAPASPPPLPDAKQRSKILWVYVGVAVIGAVVLTAYLLR